MAVRKKTLERMTRFVTAWSQADSMSHAHELAETGIADVRAQNRFRRKVEKELNIQLSPIQSKHATNQDIDCPSTLDIKACRKKKRFVITSATNDCDVDVDFFKSLEQFCFIHDAQLIVIPIRYMNPSIMTSKEYIWDSKIYPYVLKDALSIGVNTLIHGALHLQATAVNPLQGLAELSAGRNAVYGHPQVSLEGIPTPKDEMTRFMHTTGSLTKPSYSDTKAGGKAAFHHGMGALFIDVQKDFHYPMQLNWNGDSIPYLNMEYTPDGERSGSPYLAMVSGDIHADWADMKLAKKKRVILDKFMVHTHVFHDLHNHTIGSHHNTMRETVKLAMQGKLSVEKELQKAYEYVDDLSAQENLIIHSNHDDHLGKWLEAYNERRDPHNAIFAAKLKAKWFDSSESALEIVFNDMAKEDDFNYEFVGRNSAKLIGGVDVSQHGDLGVNGSRGSKGGFAKACSRMICGHTHSPCIHKGVYYAGHSLEDTKAGYASGLSTWAQADVLISGNGSRVLWLWGPVSGKRNPHYKKLVKNY